MALAINEELCIGCGVCASMLEQVYEMDDDKGIAVVKSYEGVSDDEINESIDACPVEAISL